MTITDERRWWPHDDFTWWSRLQGLDSKNVPPPTRHDHFESWKTTSPDTSWKDHLRLEWQKLIGFYLGMGWKLIPIDVRSKAPLKSSYKYESRGARGPYLDLDQALYYAEKDFNLAVVAGPSKMVWCDMDDPKLFKKEWLSGIVMRTPRGYGMPLKFTEINEDQIESLKSLGYDFRVDILYELVPISVTCSKDHHTGVRVHGEPKERCMDGGSHDYHERVWITPLTNPMLALDALIRVI